jgi:hypothetical protein
MMSSRQYCPLVSLFVLLITADSSDRCSRTVVQANIGLKGILCGFFVFRLVWVLFLSFGLLVLTFVFWLRWRQAGYWLAMLVCEVSSISFSHQHQTTDMACIDMHSTCDDKIYA